MSNLDRVFFFLVYVLSRAVTAFLHAMPVENEQGIKMGGSWEAGPGKDQCNLQSAFHTISALDHFQQEDWKIHSEG